MSSLFNQVVVAIKLTVVAIVIVAGIGYITADNYSPSSRRRSRAVTAEQPGSCNPR
ncbi:MAG: hypothetical protein WKF83_04330 [Nocardioidaceae bacterium]